MTEFTLEKVIVFSLVFVRISALIMSAPVLGSPSIPLRLKLGLGLILAFIFLPLAGSHREFLAWDMLSLVGAIFKEIVLGVSIGFIAQLVFGAISLAGQLMGVQMGFAIVNVMDPLNQANVSIIAQFLGFLSLVLFVTANFHYWFIEAIADSFQMVQLGGPILSGRLVAEVITAGGELFAIGLKIAAPVIAIMLAIYVGVGIVARTVPQMNVFIVAFPLTISVGLIGVGLVLPLLHEVLKDLFNKIVWDMSGILRVM